MARDNVIEITVKGIDQASKVFNQIAKEADRALSVIETQILDIPDIDVESNINVDHSLKQIEKVQRRIEDVPDIESQAEIETRQANKNLDDLEKELQESKKRVEELEKQLEKTETTATKSTGGMMEAFKRVGQIIATVFAIDKIKDFAVSGIEQIASLRALESQFNQVFSNMSTQARDSLNAIAQETGMLANRIKPSFVQIAAFAKTTGMDTAQSLELSSRAMKAAADIAAFYDKSIEDVTESLKSFLKGNYQVDDQLGISATEFTRNQAAMKLFKKEFNELTEAQKQFTLLHMVEEGVRLSGALGQAARESDQFENQLGNLRQAWADFKAAVMAPVLDYVVQGFKQLTQWIQNIPVDKIHESFRNVGALLKDNLLPVIDSLVEVFKSLWNTLQEAGALEVAKSLWESFKGTLEWIGDNTQLVTSALLGLSGAIVTFKILSTINSGVETFIKALNRMKNATGLAAKAQALFNTTLLTSPITWIAVAIGALIAIIILLWKNWDNVSAWLAKSWEWIKGVADKAFTAIGEAISGAWEWVRDRVISIWEGIKGTASTIFNAIGEAIMSAWNWIVETTTAIWEGIKNFFAQYWDVLLVIFLGPLGFLIQLIIKNWDTIKQAAITIFTAIADFIGNVWFAISTIAQAMWNIIKTILLDIWNSIWGAVQPYFQAIADFIAQVWEGVKNTAITVWNAIVGFFVGIWNGIVETATAIWGAISQFFTGLWEGIKNVAISVWNAIKDFFTGLWQSTVNTAETIWSPIANFFSQLWESIKNIASTVWDAISKFFDMVWQNIKNAAINTWNNIFSFLKDIWTIISSIASGIFNGISAFFSGIWNTIKNVATTIWDTIKQVLHKIWIDILMLATFEFTGIKDLITFIWNSIKGTAELIWNSIKKTLSVLWDGLKNTAINAFNAIKNGIAGAWEGLKSITQKVWNSMITIIKTPINTIIKLINGLIGALNRVKITIPKIPNWVPGIGGLGGGTIGFNIPKIPYLRMGGLVIDDTLARIGEGVDDEAVLPLNNRVMARIGRKIAENWDNDTPINGEIDYKKLAEAIKASMGEFIDLIIDAIGVKVVVENMTVRSNDDIERIAERLLMLKERYRRGRGYVYS